MTVQELIEKLQKCPPDANVYCLECRVSGFEAEVVEVDQRGDVNIWDRELWESSRHGEEVK